MLRSVLSQEQTIICSSSYLSKFPVEWRRYKYLGLKYVIPSILIIVLVIVLGVFFIGGLSKKTFTFENEDFVEPILSTTNILNSLFETVSISIDELNNQKLNLII